SKIGFGDLILLLRYFFKLKVSTHPSYFMNKLILLLVSCLILSACSSMQVRPTVGVSMGTSI
ncbi:hypothetical protein ABTF15_17380, partial [Acinetobacter baumannii]